MEWYTLITIIAGSCTILVSLIALIRKFIRNWRGMQKKVENLEHSLRVHQQIEINDDINVVRNNSALMKIPKGSTGKLVSVDEHTNLATVRICNDLLTTKVPVDKITIIEI